MAATDDDGLFVDTNVLVHANVAEAPLHRAALEAVSAAHDQGYRLWTSRQVIREHLVADCLCRPDKRSASGAWRSSLRYKVMQPLLLRCRMKGNSNGD